MKVVKAGMQQVQFPTQTSVSYEVVNDQGDPIPVAFTGTTPITVTLAGSISVDVGKVIIHDALNREAVVPTAASAKTTATNALVVQHIDDAGVPLRESTQVAIWNNQGTNATSALQVTELAALTAILNTQGTQATTGLATDAKLGNVSSAVTAILNSQGSQATSAYQASELTTLAAIMNAQGSLATSDYQASELATLGAIMNSQGTNATAVAQAQANAALATIMNNQGSQASAAYQASELATLGAIMNAQGTQATTGLATAAGVGIVANNQGTQATAVAQATQIGLLTQISNYQGTQATQATLAGIQAQFRDVTNTYGATGTAHRSSLAVDVSFDDSAAIDAFGRLRTSHPAYRFDSQLVYDTSADTWDQAFTFSTGTVTFDRTDKVANITVFTSGSAVLQSHYHAPYTPGRSQLCLMTFAFGTTPGAGATKRAGYWDGVNGIYLEQTSSATNLVLQSSTSAGNQTVAKTAWNIDKLDGTGPSGFTLDLTKAQILVISLQALYAGRVVVGFDIDGIIRPVHQFLNANNLAVPYIGQAGLPIRYEARGTGVGTSLKAICASVMSEGGEEIRHIPARTFTGGTGASPVNTTTRRPIFSVRPRKFFNQIANNGILLPTSIASFATGQSFYLELVRNPTLTGASWAAVDNSSIAEMDTTATTLAGGTTVFSTFVINTAGMPVALNENLLSRLVCCYSQLLDQPDILTLAATSLAGAGNVSAEMSWKEIR